MKLNTMLAINQHYVEKAANAFRISMEIEEHAAFIRKTCSDPKNFEPDANGVVRAGEWNDGVFAMLDDVVGEDIESAEYIFFLTPVPGLSEILKNIGKGKGEMCEIEHYHEEEREITITTDHKTYAWIKSDKKPIFEADKPELFCHLDKNADGRDTWYTYVPPCSEVKLRFPAKVAHAFLAEGTGAVVRSHHSREFRERLVNKQSHASLEIQSKNVESRCYIPTHLTDMVGNANLIEAHTYNRGFANPVIDKWAIHLMFVEQGQYVAIPIIERALEIRKNELNVLHEMGNATSQQIVDVKLHNKQTEQAATTGRCITAIIDIIYQLMEMKTRLAITNPGKYCTGNDSAMVLPSVDEFRAEHSIAGGETFSIDGSIYLKLLKLGNNHCLTWAVRNENGVCMPLTDPKIRSTAIDWKRDILENDPLKDKVKAAVKEADARFEHETGSFVGLVKDRRPGSYKDIIGKTTTTTS